MIAPRTVWDDQGALDVWLVDLGGNIAMSQCGLALVALITRLLVPRFVSTEEAVAWGSRLNAQDHETLVDVQHTASDAALAEPDPQAMVDLATDSQLLRERPTPMCRTFYTTKACRSLLTSSWCQRAAR
jgi:hypothetical protein